MDIEAATACRTVAALMEAGHYITIPDGIRKAALRGINQVFGSRGAANPNHDLPYSAALVAFYLAGEVLGES